MSTIRHTVTFALPFPAGSSEEQAFLDAARRLAGIDGVREFAVLRAVNLETEMPLMLSMEFSDQAGYEGYNADPAHRTFVERVWLPTVTAFLEADFTIEPEHQGTTSA